MQISSGNLLAIMIFEGKDFLKSQKIFSRSQKDFWRKLFEDVLKKINPDHLMIFRRKNFIT
jgi:hypothetical protein